MNCSDLALRSPAFSTSSRILDAVDSSNSFVVSTRSRPLIFTEPLMISSPGFTSLGRLSPVSALVLSDELPSVTTPSIGTFSPGLISMMLPTSTSSGSTFSTSPSCTRLA